MEITILGSGTGIPSIKRAAPGILVRIGQDYLLLDSGSGTLRQLAKVNLTSHQIGWLLYTHLHPDHTVDLITFLFNTRYHVVSKRNLAQAIIDFNNSGRDAFRSTPLCLIGPRGFKRFYKKLQGVYGRWITATSYPLILKETRQDHLKFKGWSLRTAEVVHEKYSVA